MKLEPLATVTSFMTVGSLSLSRDGQYSYEFMMALAGGSCITLLHSYWRSRTRKSDRTDTVLWAMIATMGAFFLAYFFAPILNGATIPGTDRVITLAGAAFMISVSGAPMIEWLVTGQAWKPIRSVIESWIKAREKKL